jgi:hypothetical protein
VQLPAACVAARGRRLADGVTPLHAEALGDLPSGTRPLRAFLVMERTGIEPVTSGLQILSSDGQPWSSRVDVRRACVWELSHVSRGIDDGQSDLTQI